MSAVTENLNEYIQSMGISISKMSKATGIPYGNLIASLTSKQRNRSLRDDEFLSVCSFLGKDPMDFVEKKDEMAD